MKVTFFGLVALASAVLAQDDYFQIRSPSKGTTLHSGDISTISWEKGVDGKVLVNILKGDDPQMMMPTGMAFMTSGAKNSQKWRVPENMDPKAKYALEFNYKSPDGQTAQSFSDQFMVSPATESKMTNSQGMATQDTAKKPNRRVMKISITYPNEGESTAQVNGQSVPIKMQGASEARTAQNPVKMEGASMARTAQNPVKMGSASMARTAQNPVKMGSTSKARTAQNPVKMAGTRKDIPAEGSVLDRYAARAAPY